VVTREVPVAEAYAGESRSVHITEGTIPPRPEKQE
jgi:hypothetical protein